MQSEREFFSIITVCYNAKEQIKRTIESVLKQSCCDYEYIIVDGKSSDGTFEVACNYVQEFEKKGIHYHLISEKDTGIYNAMNKGVGFSNGKWLLFLNAGDYLCSKNTLAVIKMKSFSETLDFIYGDTIFEKDTMFRYTPCEPLEIFADLKYRMPFSHQSIFMGRHIFNEYLYDERYRMCADHAFFLKAFNENREWKYIPVPVSVFQMNGFSASPANRELLKKEVLSFSYEQGVISKAQVIGEIIKLNLHKLIHNIKETVVPNAVLENRKRKIIEKRKIEDAEEGWSKVFPTICYEEEEYNN